MKMTRKLTFGNLIIKGASLPSPQAFLSMTSASGKLGARRHELDLVASEELISISFITITWVTGDKAGGQLKECEACTFFN